MSDDLVDRLRLVRSPGIGPVTYRQLIARFGSRTLRRWRPCRTSRHAAAARPPRLASRGRCRAGDRAGRGAWRALFVLGQGLYPRALAELDDAPPLLTVKGDLKLLERPLVAMVGARNASAAACRFARQLAYDLGQQGVAVVSGLARGIDSAAHDGSLETRHDRRGRRRPRHFLPAREPGPAGGDVRARAGNRRNAAGHRAAGAPLPVSQPDHRRPELPARSSSRRRRDSGSLITARLPRRPAAR